MGDGSRQVKTTPKEKAMSRDEDVGSKVGNAVPNHTPSVDVDGADAGNREDEGSVEREEGDEEGTKGKKESQLVGGTPVTSAGGRDLLFRKVSRLWLSQRAASLLGQKSNRRRGSASFCPHTCILVFTESSGGGRGRNIRCFPRFLLNFWE